MNRWHPRAGSALLFSFVLIAGCAEEGPWDRVVELDYNQRALERHIKRRIDLLRAGVRPRDELAVEKMWRNAMGYTFIARRPQKRESGISALRVKREGVPIEARARGIGRARSGLWIEDGYWIVDVFSSLDTYVNSAVVAQSMSGRRILQHLGLARRLSDAADRMFMRPEEQVYWRELLPMVVRNQGFGTIYLRALEPDLEQDGVAQMDSLGVMDRRYFTWRLQETISWWGGTSPMRVADTSSPAGKSTSCPSSTTGCCLSMHLKSCRYWAWTAPG